MKVAMLSSLPPDYGGSSGGGIAVHTVELARGLAALGVEVHVLAHNVHQRRGRTPVPFDYFTAYPFAPVRSAESLAYLLRGARRAPWRVLLRGGNSVQDARLTLRQRAAVLLHVAQYEAFLAEVGAALVHFHGSGLGLLAAWHAASLHRLPLVSTMHSLSGHVTQEFLHACVLPSLRCPDAIITVSQALRDEAAAYGLSEERLHPILNGVDADAFYPIAPRWARQRLGVPEEPFVVLFVGHLIRRKGVDFLIKAFRQVLESRPQGHLYIVGGARPYTEPDWYQNLLGLPGELGVAERVSFVGPVESHREPTLTWWYNAADVLVLPSRAEGMGMVLVEAMACGKPVIGTAVGGIPNVVRDGWNGLLVPPEDAEALAHALTRLAQDPALAQRLGAQGLQDAQTAYRWDAAAEKTLEVYRSLVAPSAR